MLFRSNRQNFLSLIDKVIFQKWHTEITLIINKEFSLIEIALTELGADMNYIQERLIPLKYYKKSSERLIQANGEKLIINYKIPIVHICYDGIYFETSSSQDRKKGRIDDLYPRKNWYPKPTPPDLQFEERHTYVNSSYSPDLIYDYRCTELILSVLHKSYYS